MNASIVTKILALSVLSIGYVSIMGAQCTYTPCEGKADEELCATQENGPVDGFCLAEDCQPGVPHDDPCADKEAGDACAPLKGGPQTGTCQETDGKLFCETSNVPSTPDADRGKVSETPGGQ